MVFDVGHGGGLEARLLHQPRMVGIDVTGADPEFARGGIRHGHSPLPVNGKGARRVHARRWVRAGSTVAPTPFKALD